MSAIGIAAVAAVIAGFVDAIAGGGGVITFPTLIMLGLPVSNIAGTSKFVTSCGTGAAAFTYWRKGFLDAPVVTRLLPLTAVGALGGAYLVLSVPNEFLKPLASFMILGIAVYAFFKPALGFESAYEGLKGTLLLKLLCGALLIGAYDGFFGPGTGMFLMLMFVRVARMDFVRSAGNTKILNLVSNVVPLGLFLLNGVVLFQYAIPMAAGNILGGYLGAHAALRVGPRLVRWVFIVMAAALTAKLLIDYF